MVEAVRRAMDAAAIQALVAAAVAEALRVTTRAAADPGQSHSNIHKYYARVEKLKEDWKEWAYQFSVATHSYSAKNGQLLEIVEKLELDEVTSRNIELEIGQAESDWMHKSKAELFSVLTLLTKGEANQLVRSCDDLNGYTAWKRLYDRFNPKTPASLTAAWREVVRPKKVKDMREAGKAIDTWEGKMTLLKREHGEEPTAGLKASLLLEMLPESVQLTVAQGMSSRRLDYDSLKAKVKLMSTVQMDYSTPKPMDIGEAEEHFDMYEDEYVEDVGSRKGKGKGPQFGSCWVCGGAHFSRDCAKAAGKGGKASSKGSAGKSKGKGKSLGPMFGSCWTCGGAHFASECPQGGGASAGGKGGGKGKGKTLKCFTCGGVGHRSSQCPTVVREIGEEVSEEEQGALECVSEGWDIFGLEESRCRAKRGRWARKEVRMVDVHNRFEALQEVEEADVDDEVGHACFDCKVDDPTDVDDEAGHVCFDCDVGVTDVAGLGGGEEVFPRRFGRWRTEAEEEDWIQWVAEDEGVKFLGRGEIVVDSGAAESVCPRNWAQGFPMKDVAWGKKRNFLNASGGRMEHYGERRVRCGVDGMNSPVNMLFQVTDARNPLASVARITENGSVVQFGPKQEDNYIYNPATGD